MVLWPFRRNTGGPESWNLQGLRVPRDPGRQSILSWIQGHGPDDEMDALPDEELAVASNDGIKFAPGVFDHMMQIHEDPKGGAQHAAAVHRAMKRLAAASTDKNLRAFYEAVMQHAVRDTVDPLMAGIIGDPSLDLGRAREIGRWLATNAPDRDAVKLAIAILHATRCASEVDTLIALARHEEFGGYAVPAIADLAPNPHRIFFELVKRQEYWGKVTLVRHLAGATDDDIRDWLFEKGWGSGVMDHSAALVCAETGGLRSRLEGDDVSSEVVITAGEIIINLFMSESMRDGPGISDYADGAFVVGRYVALLERGSLEICHWRQLKLMRSFTESEERHVPSGPEWGAGLRADLAARIATMLDWPGWPSVVIDAMESGDADERWAGALAAEDLGIDTWPYRFRWAEKGTNEHWIGIFSTRDPDRLRRAVAFAAPRLTLARLGTGPTMSAAPMQWAEEADIKGQHHKLESVLVALRGLPGERWAFVETGLRSPYSRVRRAAVVTLSRWPHELRPEGSSDTLRQCLEAEPDEELRPLMERALAGEQLHDIHDEPSPFRRGQSDA
jgi:hypothetical protein